jgi:hypothetical protein
MGLNCLLLYEFLLLFGSMFLVNAHTDVSPDDLKATISSTMAFCVDDVRTHVGPPPSYLLPQVPLNVEGYDIAPEGLNLEQVHVYVRHGEHYASLVDGFISCLSR